ncbi:MAG TPA: ABC transporter permease [Puia sp.]|nr:ABC transporter permease [Puia sp.]
MWRNYLIVAFRNLRRNKVFSLVNILGLAIGLMTCLLIMVYVLDEMSYDRQFKDVDRVYRIALHGANEDWSSAPAPMSWALKADMPEVEQTTRLLKLIGMTNFIVSYRQGGEDRNFSETNAYYVDSTFFNVLSYPFISGDPATALDRPNTVVLSATLAGKLFGKADPMGHQIKIDAGSGPIAYAVSGVFQDKDLHTHIPAHLFLSMNSAEVSWVNQIGNWAMENIFHTYIKLRPGTDPVAFEKKLTPFFYRHGGEDLKLNGMAKNLVLQPVKDIYLHSNMGNEIGTNGSIRTLYILISIAVFILVIACINFMNLATARSEHRAREVGVRKVMGAMQGSLIRMFLSESFLLCLLSLLVAIILTSTLLPVFDTLTGKDLQPWHEPRLLLVITGLTLFAGLLSGCYPAFYLSSFKPVAVLKGKLIHHFSAALLRKSLVVFQFSVGIALILGAIVVGRQMTLFKEQDLGFDKDRQIVLPLQTKQSMANYNVLRDALSNSTYFKSVTSGSTYPGIPSIFDMIFYPPGKTGKDFVDIYLCNSNKDYFQTLGLTLLAGRQLEPEVKADSNALVLNTTAVKKLGFTTANAVGQQISYPWQGAMVAMRIVGVVRDFNTEGLQKPIRSAGFSTSDFFGNRYSYAIAKIQTADLSAALTYLRATWNRINPGTPFNYSFIDQDFARNYEKEQRTSTLVMYFTGIAILIACLGLFGLTAFAAEQRIKEIGIRKVLGATTANVTLLLSADLIRLVGIAILIASPLAALAMNKWLHNFAYRVHLSWWMFVTAAAGATLTAIITVSFQAIRAARANPIRNLRSE